MIHFHHFIRVAFSHMILTAMKMPLQLRNYVAHIHFSSKILHKINLKTSIT